VYLAYFTALRIGPVSIVSPVVVAYGGMTVVLAVLFRGETLTPAQAAGAVIATAGVVLAAITFDLRTLRGARIAGAGVAIAVFTLVGFAVMTVALAGPIREHGWLPVIVGSRIGNTAGALAILAFGLGAGASRLRPLMIPWRGWSRVAVVAVVCSGLFDVTGFIAFSIGLEVAPAWLIGLASSFGPVLVVGWAILWLGERPRPNQWLGLAILAAGVAVLALAG
jgi:transporter family protein